MTLSDEFGPWRSRVVEISKGYRVQLRCPVRGREFNDGPEERVRQGLLHFLVDLSNIVPFELSAERQRHDIALRWLASDVFQPPTPPLLIVETKVDRVAGERTNEQLAGYLGETAGTTGVVFTGDRMWRVDRTQTGTQVVHMSSLADLATLVRERAEQDPLADERADFDAAHAGDLVALAKLVARFRYATFVLKVGTREVPCRDLRFTSDAIEYRPADYHARQRSRVLRSDVTSLVRLAP